MNSTGAGLLVRGVFLIIILVGVLIAYKSIQGKRDHARKCREYERNKK
jgi:hypothetical protein